MANRLFQIILCTLILTGMSACSTLGSFGGGKIESKLSDQENIMFQNAFFAAQSAKSTGQMEKAYSEFIKCESLQPNNDAVKYELARLDIVNKKPEPAQERLNQAISIDPENAWYRKTRADLYMDYSRFSDAEKDLQWLVQNHDDINHYYDLSTCLLYQEKGEEAIAIYNQLEKKVGESEELYLQKFQIRLAMEQQEKALEELDQALAKLPGSLALLGEKSNLLLSLKQDEKAFKVLQKMEQLDPQNGMVQLQLADYYNSAGDATASFDALLKAFQSDEVNIDQKIAILLRFYGRSEFDKTALQQAYELLEKLTLQHPKEAKTHSITGDFLLREEKYQEARTAYEKAVELDPSRNAIWLQILNIDLQLRDWDKLIIDGDRLIELYPTQPDAYLMKATGQMQLSQFDEALSTLSLGKNMVVDNKPLQAQFASSEGEAYNELKQYSKSDKAYDKAISLDPNNPFVLNNYAYYLSVRNDNLELAEQHSKRSNELIPGTSSFEDTYGWILFRLKKYDEAILWIELAMDHGGSTDGVVLEHYGDVLYFLDRKEEANSFWIKAKANGGGSENLDLKISTGKFHD
jgi:tetratricopeptide (TPR) repeat protein